MVKTTNAQTETVDELKTKVRELEDLLSQLGHEVVDSTMDAARARIETLRVQADLGRMDARDDARARVAEAGEMLQTARIRFELVTAESSDVGAALVEGLRSARGDLEAAVQLVEERVTAGLRG